MTKALLHSESLRVHPVVELHVCLHAIVESTNDRDYIYVTRQHKRVLSGGRSVNGVIRFGMVDKAFIQRSSFLPRQLL